MNRLVILLISGFVFWGGSGCASSQVKKDSGVGLAQLDFREVVSEAKDKVFPAVVFIKCLRETHETGHKSSQEVAGSGVIISPAGEVLTNWHVVDKATQIRCLLYDGTAMDAKMIGSDKDTDLALLKLQPSEATAATTRPASCPADQTAPSVKTLPYARIGDSRLLKEGDFVMAMGAPWGLSRSVSIGIISCTRRFLPGSSEYNLWLQTDASISPGNSGGPLVNTEGCVIGINALKGGELGFAIPSETFEQVVAQLRQYGKMNWSWTGLQLQPLKDFEKNQYFEGEEGVMVSETDPDSPARKAGILPRDRILQVNGRPVTVLRSEDLPAIHRLLGTLAKHEPAQFLVRRGDQTLPIVVTPREKGKVEGEELDCPRWDLTVKTINQFDNEDLFYYRKKGVFVFGVKDEGNASSAGLNRQDIIVSIDGKEVFTLDEVKAIHKETLENIQKKHKILFTVIRNGVTRQVLMDFLRDYQKE